MIQVYKSEQIGTKTQHQRKEDPSKCYSTKISQVNASLGTVRYCANEALKALERAELFRKDNKFAQASVTEGEVDKYLGQLIEACQKAKTKAEEARARFKERKFK